MGNDDGCHQEWGDVIRATREEKGLSQRELAQLADVNRSTLRRFEGGLTPGSIDMIESAAYVLGLQFKLVPVESV